MKTKIITLSVVALFISSITIAAIRRVGYTGIPLAGVDYPDFQSAHDASGSNSDKRDTIQIYGTPASAGILTKPLIIMGFGYNLDANPGLQAVNTENPSYVVLQFNKGSENSIVEGCFGDFELHTSNITIRRCSVGRLSWNDLVGPINNTRIESSVIQLVGHSGSNPTTNTEFFNCIIQQLGFRNPLSTGSVINCVTGKNFFYNQWDFGDAKFLVKNCIIGSYDGSSGGRPNTRNSNTLFENNLFGTEPPVPLPAGSNNRWEQNWSEIFTETGGFYAGHISELPFDEDYFVLKPGSPAINFGRDALGNPTDAGIYGGEPAYRYKLSGVPAVPAIYKLTAPSNSASANPYNVTISIRSNN